MPVSIARPAFAVTIGLVVVGTLLRAAFLLWHPPFTTDFYDYDAVLPWAGSWFWMHMLVGAPGFAALFVGLAALTATLTRERAGALGVVGGVIGAVGGLAFAFGLAAEGALWGWALDPAVVDAATGAALLRGVEAGPPLTTLMLVAASAVVIPVGVLLQLVALALSRALPLWLPIATGAVLLLALLPVPGLDAARAVLESAALLTIAVYAVRWRRRSAV